VRARFRLRHGTSSCPDRGDQIGIVFVVLVAALVALLASRARRAPDGEALWFVRFDAETVSVTIPNPSLQSVRWDEITRIQVRTTDEGPWAPDVLWGLHRAEGDPVIHLNGATGLQELLGEMGHRLPDIRHDEVIWAMGTTSNAIFVVWEHASSEQTS